MKYSILITALCVFGLSAQASAQTRSCSELPSIAQEEVLVSSVVIPRIPDPILVRMPSVKDLYLRALCGVQPAGVWQLIESGEGALMTLPEQLAAELNAAVPFLPNVRYLYVRGGGVDGEVIVLLFADGYNGPIFEFSAPGTWTADHARVPIEHWNRLPYEFLRQATRQAHDIALFDGTYRPQRTEGLQRWINSNSIYRAARNLSDEIIELDFSLDRAMANPLGSVFVPIDSDDEEEGVWIHELAHFHHYDDEGPSALAYARGFTGIARRNGRVLGVEIPFWVKQRYEGAVGWCNDDANAGNDIPWGYTSWYGRCGEWRLAEDYAESMCAALGASQEILTNPYGQFGDDPTTTEDDRIVNRSFNPRERLYDRFDTDAFLMQARTSWIRDHLGIDLYGPQDADGDGLFWQNGRSDGDCNDINPVVGECTFDSCTLHADCDDANPCTTDLCGVGNRCVHSATDVDDDGSPDIQVDTTGDGTLNYTCPGDDCDSSDSSIHAGSTQSCTHRCGFAGQQSCLSGGEFSECSGPSSCDCVPGETTVVPCGDRCGFSLAQCNSAGEWVNSGTCESEGECAAGSRTTPRTVSEAITCEGGGAIGTETYSEYEDCNAACELGPTQRMLTGRDEVTEPEVCDGVDNDCVGGVDNGCPTLVQFGSPQEGGLLGYDLSRTDWGLLRCAVGSVMTGIQLDQEQERPKFDNMRILCSNMRLNQIGPESFDFEIGNRVFGSGGGGSNDHQLTCPEGTAVVAVRGRGDRLAPARWLTGVQLVCARPSVGGDAGTFRIAWGTETQTASYPREANETSLCNAGSVVTSLNVSSTNDGIKGMRARCQHASLLLRQ